MQLVYNWHITENATIHVIIVFQNGEFSGDLER